MNIYCLAAIVFGITSFSVGFEILIRRKDYMGVCYFIVSCLYAVWGISVGVGISGALSYADSLFQARLHNLAALFVPVAWLHFVTLYTDQPNWEKRVIWLYFVPLPVALFFNTDLFVPGLQQTWIFPYYATPGILFHLSPLLFFTLIPLSFKLLFADLKNHQADEKLKRRNFIIIALIGYLAGAMTYLSVYGVNVPQYGLLALPLYPFGLTYFMSESGLLDGARMAQVAHKDKLAALGILTASINHEIRGPLFAMRGAVENEENMDTMRPKLLSQIDRLTGIVSRLTHFAKKGVDEAAKIEALDFSEVINDVEPLLKHQFHYQNIQLTKEVAENLPLVSADRRYLEEILFNLLINACQALKNTQSPTIKLSASIFEDHRRSTIDDRLSDLSFPRRRESSSDSQSVSRQSVVGGRSAIIVTIADNGPGIAPDQIKHIFKPFHTSKAEGTGLGLYITKQLIEKCSGKIEVQSAAGKGAKFTVHLKAAYEAG